MNKKSGFGRIFCACAIHEHFVAAVEWNEAASGGAAVAVTV